MAINKVLNEFRANATEDEWKQLATDQEAMSADDFTEKYGFTFSSVRKELVEKGLYELKRNTTPKPQTVEEELTEADIIVPRFFTKGESKNTSVNLRRDILAALDKAYAANSLYDKRHVINALLMEALTNHGYYTREE